MVLKEAGMTSIHISRRALLALIPAGLALTLVPGCATETVIAVTKDPNCGCCGKWVDHLKAAGYAATVNESAAVNPLKDRLGIPEDTRSCHTAEVAGYFLEGHVPASAIARLLADRPDVKGLAVPGMPVGSPGMEVAGTPDDEYDVLAIAKDGSVRTYMRFRGKTARS